jgi:hypothetical protein
MADLAEHELDGLRGALIVFDKEYSHRAFPAGAEWKQRTGRQASMQKLRKARFKGPLGNAMRPLFETGTSARSHCPQSNIERS